VKYRFRFLLLLVYGGTGITALAYEILWTRMLSLLFGISIFGVVLTVAAFMAGLGAGSLAGTGRGRRLSPSQALLLLALLEGGIAMYALLLPLVMPWLDAGLLYLGRGLSISAWQGLQGTAVLLLLLPAAMAMGYAFPLALRAAAALDVSLGGMYGANALGGAMGSLLPLLLLPVLGWRSALAVVATLGLVLAVLAWLLSGRLVTAVGEGERVFKPPAMPRPPVADLFAYAGIGAAALIFEVVWTRQYGMVLLRTEYVLAVLLMVYLAGIGLGSVLARRLRSAVHVGRWLNALPVCAALLAIGGQYALPSVSQWASRTEFNSLFQGMAMQGGAVLLLTLPVTLALGAWLPLLAQKFIEFGYNPHDGGSGSRVLSDSVSGGWLYGANSLGAAFGALMAGFVFIPWLGSSASPGLGALFLLLCGMRWVTDARLWLLVPLVPLVLWPVRHMPPVSALLPALSDARDLSLYEDAVAVTHVVEKPSGQRLLLSDLQRMDASSDPVAVTVQKNQARLPLLLRPGARSILFLGLGTGITAAGSLPYDRVQRTAVELSAGAIAAANEAFAPVNGHVMDKMRVLHDDARRFLRAGGSSYDVIVGDLFHPDMVGRANLLSVQQFKRVRERLAAGGVFVQWLALNQFDTATLKVILQSFRSIFAAEKGDALLFIDGYRVALVGLKQGEIDSERLVQRMQQLLPAERQEATGGEGVWTWLGRYWGRIPRYAQVPLQDEWAPVIEFSLPRVRFSGGVDAVAMWRWMLSWREGADKAARTLHVRKEDFGIFKRAWAASGLDVRLWLAELAGNDHRAVEWAQLAYRANANDRWPAFALADRMFASLESGKMPGLDRRKALLRILALRPDHEGAVRAMMHLELQHGDAAQTWRRRLAALSPLAFDMRQR